MIKQKILSNVETYFQQILLKQLGKAIVAATKNLLNELISILNFNTDLNIQITRRLVLQLMNCISMLAKFILFCNQIVRKTDPISC
jgi:hypothetical protein